MRITKPSLTRLARKAGIKSISEETFPYIYAVFEQHLTDVLRTSLHVNEYMGTKTLMQENVYTALSFFDQNLAQSQDLSFNTVQR